LHAVLHYYIDVHVHDILNELPPPPLSPGCPDVPVYNFGGLAHLINRQFSVCCHHICHICDFVFININNIAYDVASDIVCKSSEQCPRVRLRPGYNWFCICTGGLGLRANNLDSVCDLHNTSPPISLQTSNSLIGCNGYDVCNFDDVYACNHDFIDNSVITSNTHTANGCYTAIDDVSEACDVPSVNDVSLTVIGCSNDDVHTIVNIGHVSPIVDDVSAIDYISSNVIGHNSDDVAGIVSFNDVSFISGIL
jgi:hypothetical protein